MVYGDFITKEEIMVHKTAGAPRLVKLDFPRFNGGEDPTSWICHAEQFFRFYETPLEDQVALASFHL